MIGAIIQARMGSTRLPGKVLQDLYGKCVLEYLVDRVRQSELFEKIIVATTDQSEDDLIAQFCLSKGVDCYRGSEFDVLKRYYGAHSFISLM